MPKSKWASSPWYVSTRSLALGAIWSTYRLFGCFGGIVIVLAIIEKVPLLTGLALGVTCMLYADVCHAVYNSVKR